MNPQITILTPSLSNHDVMEAHFEWFYELNNFNIELIIIDQNVEPSQFLTKKSTEISRFIYMHNSDKGLSKNRNVGAKLASGNYILFLDDDARFNNGMADSLLLSIVNSNYDIVLCSIVDNEGALTSYTPFTEECLVQVKSVEGRVNSNGILAKRNIVTQHQFDEKMGVGSIYGSCEEIDFVVRTIIAGGKVIYTPSNKITHPPKEYDTRKAFNYGIGHGYFTSKLFFQYPPIACKYLAFIKIAKCLSKFALSIILPSTKTVNYRAWSHGFIKGFIKDVK
jgi:glycosyltransferase involved in cell wall biosynthesis